MFLWKITHGPRKSSESTLLYITSLNRTVFVRVLLLLLTVCFPETCVPKYFGASVCAV